MSFGSPLETILWREYKPVWLRRRATNTNSVERHERKRASLATRGKAVPGRRNAVVCYL